jgi:putative acetyltransferase
MPTGTVGGASHHDWTIRAFRPEDAGPLSRIYRAAVQTLAARLYTPDQIGAWLSIAPKPRDIAEIYGAVRTALVCETKGWPIGFSDHNAKGHIRFLYCHPDHARRGVAHGLLEAVETSARNARISSLTSEASEAALPAFTRHGFRTVERRDVAITGVAIHNYAVEKRLLSISPTASQGDLLK